MVANVACIYVSTVQLWCGVWKILPCWTAGNLVAEVVTVRSI